MNKEAALQRVREDRLLIDEVDRWLYEEIAPFLGRRVLEIGCGLGNFARYLTDRELYVGVDVSAASVAHVRETYGARPNMQAHVCDVVDDQFLGFGRLGIDTVFSLNVLEHIENQRAALHNAQAILQAEGTLVLVVPAHDWLYGSIDQAIGHRRRYDKEGMARLLNELGLTCVHQKYLNALGAVGWFVNGRILKRETPPSGQLRLFNVLVPWLKRFEHVVSMPLGISLLTVGRPPAGREA